MFIVLSGMLSAVAIVIVMCRLDMKKFAGYPAICDTAVTLGLGFILYGTWSGMVAAIVGGLTFSLMLTIYRYCFGYKRMTIKGWKTTQGVMECL